MPSRQLRWTFALILQVSGAAEEGTLFVSTMAGGGETSVKNHSQVFNNDSCHYCSSLTLSALSHSLCFVLFVLSLFWSFLFSDSWLPLNGVPSSSLVIGTFFLPAVAKFLYRIFRVFSPILNAKQQIFFN